LANFETEELLLLELKTVDEWETDQKGLWFWERIGRLPFALLDKATPKFIHEKIGVALDEIGSYIQSGGQYLINENTILKRFAAKDPALVIDEVRLDAVRQFPLSTMDEIAGEMRSTRTKFASIQGATTGVGGLFTLSIDIPLLLGLSLKVVQEIALCYGYDPNDKAERIFIVKCLQFTSSDIVGKKVILEELSAFHPGRQNDQMFSQLQGWREVVLTYRDNFGWKKLFQMIPIAGILFGAWINRSTIGDVAETAMMLYRKRRILERLGELETI
jgi:hypothetical protein